MTADSLQDLLKWAQRVGGSLRSTEENDGIHQGQSLLKLPTI